MNIIYYFLVLFVLIPYENNKQKQQVCIKFDHIANSKILISGDSLYFPDGTNYSVIKLKYYLSHISFTTQKNKVVKMPGIYLIDAFATDSFFCALPEGKYTQLNFMLGLDSAVHMGGASTGALDPLNDMYWAWNTGYVHFKLEGFAAESTADQHRIQYHLGGFKAPYASQQQIHISLQNFEIKKQGNTASSLHLAVNLDTFFDTKEQVKNMPAIMKPGNEALSFSRKLPGMFSFSSFQ